LTLLSLLLLLLLLLSLLHDDFLRHSVTLHLAFKGVRRFVLLTWQAFETARRILFSGAAGNWLQFVAGVVFLTLFLSLSLFFFDRVCVCPCVLCVRCLHTVAPPHTHKTLCLSQCKNKQITQTPSLVQCLSFSNRLSFSHRLSVSSWL
jgi:hypothetical protein